MKPIQIGDKLIRNNQDLFFIVEAGVNHNGNIDLAMKMIDKAAEMNADAIKFQTYITDDLVQLDAPLAKYQRENTGNETTQYEMLKKLELPLESFKILKKHCDDRGIMFLSTPHSGGKVLDALDLIMPAYKIGSGDLTNHPFLRQVARKKKPMILGTGMATLDEVIDAVSVIEKDGNENIILLHCTTEYPCNYEDVNLQAMKTMMNTFRYPIGYSDHTVGWQVPVMAVTLGAVVIEKHFTLDKTLPGPDHVASANPVEMADTITRCRAVKKILGSPEKKPSEAELKNIPIARKSLYFSKDLLAGTIISESDIVIRRPGQGLSPKLFDSIIGKKLVVSVKKGQNVQIEMLDDE
jgi:N-acetylneuraminate synthase/N,N'-diacetyllegionaminate synthase